MRASAKITAIAALSLGLAATALASYTPQLIVPNGANATQYHDKTYTFAATDSSGYWTVLGSVHEDQNGDTTQTTSDVPEWLIGGDNAPYEVTVMVTNGAPTLTASSSYVCDGNYVSSMPYSSLSMISFSAEDSQWSHPADCY